MGTENLRYHDTPVNELARALAPHLGGTQKLIGGDELYEGYALVSVPAKGDWPEYEVSLSLRGYGAQKNKLTVRLSPAKLSNEISTRDLVFPEAGISIDRPRETLLREIERRVVNPAGKAMLIEYNKRLVALRDRDATLKAALDELLRDCPVCRTSFNAPISSGATSVTIYGRGKASFDARLYANGEMSFERIFSVDKAKARRILAILEEV